MRMRKILMFSIWTLCTLCFLLMPQAANQGILIGLQICSSAVLTSLFPFFIMTNFWISAGYADLLSNLAAPLTERIFHIPGAASSALILGSIGGYPIGCKTVATLYSAGRLRKEQAEHTAMFCNNAGPAFVLNIIGVGIFQSTRIGIYLYVVHLLSAFLLGFIFRPKISRYDASQHSRTTTPPFSHLLTTSITDAGKTAILVCIYILFFSILTQCLQSLLPIGRLATGILELAGSARLLSQAQLPYRIKWIIAAFLLGFGGVCVLLQSISLLQTVGLSPRKLIFGKLLHGLTSAAIATLLIPLLPVPHPCGFAEYHLFPSFILTVSILLLVSAGFRFLKESTGKSEYNRV